MDPLVGFFGSDDIGVFSSDSDSEDLHPNGNAEQDNPTKSCTSIDILPSELPPEIEEGNIEYKRKLVSVSPSRFEHLVTQMKWRLQEGHGEAIYEIGVADHGQLLGLDEEEFESSLETLANMASRLDATLVTLRERKISCSEGGPDRRAVEVLVRKVPDDQQFIDLRVSVLGSAQSGKSTLLGVLTNGQLDNGRGRARLNLFRHLHEIKSGHTSCISYGTIGFDSHGQLVNYSTVESRTTEEIFQTSSKIISFIDLAGHPKYMKTTMFGLSSHAPDFALLTVAASSGITATVREHLGFAHALELPTFVVITKTDAVSSSTVKRTLEQVRAMFTAPGSTQLPFPVNNEDDAVTLAARMSSDKITPIFTVSSVTGENLDLLQKFLNVLPPTWSHIEREKLAQRPPIFQIDSVYTVPEVGMVVGGLLKEGSIRQSDRVLVGPTKAGSFLRARVASVHRSRLHRARLVTAGEAATLSLAISQSDIVRKGMVVLTKESQPTACLVFDAKIYVLYHVGTINTGFKMTVYIGSVCQMATVERIQDKESLQCGDEAVVTFRFAQVPEFIQAGARILFRQSVSKGMGHVTFVHNVVPDELTTQPCR